MLAWLKESPTVEAYRKRLAVWMTVTGPFHVPELAKLLMEKRTAEGKLIPVRQLLPEIIGKELLINEIKDGPKSLLVEVLDFVYFLKPKVVRKKLDIAIMSESSLGKDWLKPEEVGADIVEALEIVDPSFPASAKFNLKVRLSTRYLLSPQSSELSPFFEAIVPNVLSVL